MLLQQVWLLTVLLMVYTLSGRAQNSTAPEKPLICYDGNQVDPVPLTADFPKGFKKCVSDGRYYNNKTCAEYRRKIPEGEVEFKTVNMFCGDCRYAEDAGMECRQCDTDLCNDKWARELLPFISEMRHCYKSMQVGSFVGPQRVLCPRNESCSTSAEPGYYTIVGCESHCKNSKWGQCEYCDTDLCNRHGETYEVAVNPRVTASDLAVCVSSPVAQPTAQVAVLAVVAALALRRLRQ